MLNENMLISASKALRGITTAQAAVDEAKRLVEEAKAGVENARNGLSEAKAAYDAVIAEIAGTGLSASKARKAVEDMLRIFADVGIIDTPADEPASAEPKAPRRKKAEVAPASVETSATEEAAASVKPVAEVTEPVAAPESAAVIEEEASVNHEVPAPVETAAAVDAPVEDAAEDQVSTDEVTEIDNGEAIGEIYALIESSTESEDISVSEALITLLNAADWYSREHRKEALTLDLYREVLSIDFVNQAVASDGLDREMKGALEAVGKLDAAESIFEWFLYVLGKLENGSKHVSYAEHVAQNSTAASDPVAKVVEVEEVAVVEVVAEASELAVADEVDEEVEADSSDYIPDPEADEDLSDDVSDDVTLAADDGLIGVEVDDIEEINFLEQPQAPAAADVPEAAATPVAEGAAPRGFKRPTFLNKKG